ncbi:hypothetical protein GOP47_0006408 [Adiantum capillus-veneris]|uniref:Uncharacterized protein n=1 Tax=Adiantum capillus-veneris TaxID=13818 RepID=A0A9D4V3M4_ADICA|nr:hypothetical protein GOP47_0006408 [Adiantum capillus-veneris]
MVPACYLLTMVKGETPYWPVLAPVCGFVVDGDPVCGFVVDGDVQCSLLRYSVPWTGGGMALLRGSTWNCGGTSPSSMVSCR